MQKPITVSIVKSTPSGSGQVDVRESSSRKDSLTYSSLWPHMKYAWRTLFLQSRAAVKARLLLSLEWGGKSRIVLSLEQARSFQVQAPGFFGNVILRNIEGIHFFESGPCDSNHTQSYFLDIVIKSTPFVGLFTSKPFFFSVQLPKYTEAIRNNRWKGRTSALIFASNNCIPLRTFTGYLSLKAFFGTTSY